MAEIAPINNFKQRVKLADQLPLKTPFSIYVFPTTYCNFKCIYCAHSLGTEGMKAKYGFEKQNMNMSTYHNIIEQIRAFPNKIKLLSLTGQGEPLLNKNLPEMVGMAKEANIADRIEVISNGALLTPQLSDALIDAGLDGLRISLQGVTNEKYREVCGTNISFAELVENLSYFYKHKKACDLFVKVMDIALDKGDEEKFYNIFDTIADRIYIETCRPVYEGVEFTKNMDASEMDRFGNKHDHRIVCPNCFYMLGVYPNGDVTPCCAIYKPIILGNVHNESLYDMFNGKKLKDFQKLQLIGKRSKLKGCSDCCAPDDVSNPLDILDNDSKILLNKLYNKKNES